MSNPTKDHINWADLAIDLYDKLTGRGAEIIYEFSNLEIQIPTSATANPQHATWRINGIVKIRTKDEKAAPVA
jgi:hypothetical protein